MNGDPSKLVPFAEGLDHPEGVTVTSDGKLYAGGESGQIYHIDIETGKFEETANTGGFLLGLCADSRGRLYCCDVGRREVLLVDPDSGSVELYSNGTADRPMINPNWPVFDSKGNLFVTDSGTWKGNDGCIFRVTPDRTTEVWSTSSTNFPNGACLSIDSKSLLVLESCTPALVRIAFEADGSSGGRDEIVRLEGTVPDGVTIDTDGNAYVCCYRPDRILRVSTDGEIEILADDPEGTLLSAPTNGVWVGSNLDTFVTGNLGRWHLTKCTWGANGVPLEYPDIQSEP